jgi:PadR family transcriptional regulator PadR
MGRNQSRPSSKSENLRVTYQGLKVLRAFVDAYSDNVRTRLAGADIMRAAHLSSGTMYPLLVRLEKAGIIAGDWEDDDPERLGRPLRRLYRLTPSGMQFAREALRTVSPGAVLAPGEG